MKQVPTRKGVDKSRRAGVLLHPTSLPGRDDNGDMGHDAYRFIEFLQQQGYRVWQMLPLGPTHEDKSPYQCLSSHAGNPMLISLDWLVDKGWLDLSKIKLDQAADGYRIACLQQAAQQFYKLKNDDPWHQRFAEFKTKHWHWLDDYSLFMALKSRNHGHPWTSWPLQDRQREPHVLQTVREELSALIAQTLFEQFVFFTQWHEIRVYAKQHDVELFGDMPIFVATDSADVWAQKENFLMDENGEMSYVAGVPPDAFSDTGQRWGNPLYDWDYMQSTNFEWWKQRFNTQLELFDMIRVDHFRGLQACWYIPADDETAINGEWVEVPGRQMIEELFSAFTDMSLVAEDLGVITDEVIALKNHFDLPGMKVLQFAFDGNSQNPHLPHAHLPNDVIYTGTHDNDTTLGWVQNIDNYNAEFFSEYTATKKLADEEMLLHMIRLAMASVSFLSVIPLQDVLKLDSQSRMNMPGTLGGNWHWRFEWSQFDSDFNQKIQQLMTIYQRL
jgi:4-alpha-glucanotransferase